MMNCNEWIGLKRSAMPGINDVFECRLDRQHTRVSLLQSLIKLCTRHSTAS